MCAAERQVGVAVGQELGVEQLKSNVETREAASWQMDGGCDKPTNFFVCLTSNRWTTSWTGALRVIFAAENKEARAANVTTYFSPL